MSWYKKQTPKAPELEITPAEEILKLVTQPVRLPHLSAIAGRDILVRVGVVSQPLLEEISSRPFIRMLEEEVDAHLALMSPEERKEVDFGSQKTLEALLRAGVYEPRISPAGEPPPPGTIPVEALHLDRFFLMQKILVVNGLWTNLLLRAVAAARLAGGHGEQTPGAKETEKHDA